MAGETFRQPGRRRPYRHIERRYIVEYVANKYPKRIAAYFNIRLGPPPEIMRRMYPGVPERHFKVWTPWADAVVVTSDSIDVIEAKIRNPRQAIGQLQDYARRVPLTPELARFLPRPIRMILVVPLYDPELAKTCAQFGIILDVFCPAWVIEYMREVKLIP